LALGIARPGTRESERGGVELTIGRAGARANGRSALSTAREGKASKQSKQPYLLR
jgi:hypothetical protein